MEFGILCQNLAFKETGAQCLCDISVQPLMGGFSKSRETQAVLVFVFANEYRSLAPLLTTTGKIELHMRLACVGIRDDDLLKLPATEGLRLNILTKLL